eukprot:8791549-Pyramimonas_sp.AAC.1
MHAEMVVSSDVSAPPRLCGCHNRPRASTHHKHMPAQKGKRCVHYEQHTCALSNRRCCNGVGLGGGRYIIHRWLGGLEAT